MTFEALTQLSDKEYDYLIRMALAAKSDSKYPRNVTGMMLYKVAEAAGIDVKLLKGAARKSHIKRREGKRQVERDL